MKRWLAGILSIAAILGMFGGCAGLTAPSGQAAATPSERERAARAAAVERARDMFDQAKVAGGELAAPFDYYLAEEYLNLATHESSGGDKDGVIAFAEQSAIHSEEAIRLAGRDTR